MQDRIRSDEFPETKDDSKIHEKAHTEEQIKQTYQQVRPPRVKPAKEQQHYEEEHDSFPSSPEEDRKGQGKFERGTGSLDESFEMDAGHDDEDYLDPKRGDDQQDSPDIRDDEDSDEEDRVSFANIDKASDHEIVPKPRVTPTQKSENKYFQADDALKRAPRQNEPEKQSKYDMYSDSSTPNQRARGGNSTKEDRRGRDYSKPYNPQFKEQIQRAKERVSSLSPDEKSVNEKRCEEEWRRRKEAIEASLGRCPSDKATRKDPLY